MNDDDGTLTEAERRAMPGWAQRWIERALSTERADWARVEEGIPEGYRRVAD